MNDYDDDFEGRPPVPGSTQRTRRTSQRGNERMSPEPTPSGSGSTAKAAVAGGIAGAAVSAALVGVLMATGVLGATRTTSTATVGSLSDASGSAQTISLQTASEDATVAEAVAAKCLPSVVSVYVETAEGSGIGSGVILDTDGNIITNWHVAGDATSISVTIDGTSYPATLVGGDSSSDIAVIKADLGGAIVTPIEVGDSSALVVGDWVMTLGSPLGLEQSASSGIVSALYRNQLMTGTDGNTLYTNLIQVDAAINGGNSGGALVNEQGQLVGINTLYANGSGAQAFAGIGFAIPGNYAVEIANKVIAGEQVTHAYIGLSCATVNAQNAQANHLSVDQGAYVAEVTEGGPGAAAGFEVGDIITRIGDMDVTSADSYILAIRSHSVGDMVDVEIMRGSEQMTLTVELGSDEELQAAQAEEAQRQQEEQSQQEQQYQEFLEQYEQYLQQQQSWPFNTYNMGPRF